jgi:hypothetical protein
MEIAFAPQRILCLTETLSWDEARERAWDKKTSVFATGLGKLFTRPKPDEIRITDQEKRWEPFWHVVCSSRFVFDRRQHYRLPMSQPEVRSVVIDDHEYLPGGEPRGLTLVGLEKCRVEDTASRLVDAVTGEPAEYWHFMEFDAQPIESVADWRPADSTVVPPQIRASTVTRDALVNLIKPLDADTIHQDLITIERVDLYFRPVYAFAFHWTPKERSTIAEFDGLTGKTKLENVHIHEPVGKMLSADVLLDVGIDAIDLLVPGGGINIKLARPTDLAGQ